MEQRRKYQRYPVALPATLFGAGSAPGRRCSIIEVSHAGLIIELDKQAPLRVNQNLMVEIHMPGKENPVNALINLKWLKPSAREQDNRIAGGARITIMKPEDRRALLDYACEQLLMAERAS